MPVYKFKCEKCFFVFPIALQYEKRNEKVACRKCDGECSRLLSVPLKAEVFEMADSFKGKHIIRDINKVLEERKEKHRYD